MKIQHFTQQGQHVIVYFAGWSTPPSVVQHLRLPENYDLVICYDYRHLVCDFDFTGYQNIRVVAWSMGVWVAERIMQPYQLTSATAINGTGYPCHDQFGIPCVLFEGTLTGLNEENRLKFERRICGSKAAILDYQQLGSHPTLEQIRIELTALYQALQQDQRTDLITWDKAIIGTKDKIFPARHQRDYWQPRCQITEVEAEHLLFPQFSHWTQCWEVECKS